MKSGMTFHEMTNEIKRQAESKADYIVDTRRLEMEPCATGPTLRVLADDGADMIEPLDIRPIAHRQIQDYLKIPAGYYDRMLTHSPGLLARNVNNWFHHEPARRMIRTLDNSARAFRSDRYRRIDNLEILQSALPVIGEMPDARFESCCVTESRMYVKVVNPRLETEVRVGDVVQAGILISNSEVGEGSVNIQPLVIRLVCMNGMVVNDAAIRKNHLGRVNSADENFMLYSDATLIADDQAFMLKIRDTVRAVVDEARFSQVVGLMREAADAKMTSGDIPAVVKLTSRDFGLNENEETGVLNHLIQDRDYTLYGLSNAVTRFSQDVDNYDRATKLESVGYDILSMSGSQWNRLNSAASKAAA